MTTKLIVVLMCLLTFACKKADKSEELQLANEAGFNKKDLSAINEYFEYELKSNSNAKKSNFLNSLKVSLKLKEGIKVSSSDNKELIVIPVNNNLSINVTTAQSHNKYLKCTVNNDKIEEVTVIVLIPSSDNEDLADATLLTKIINKSVHNFSGIMATLTTSNKYVDEYVYQNGSMKETRLIKPQTKSGSTNRECTDWYWVTYGLHGEIISESYLFTTCIGGCEETRQVDNTSEPVALRCSGGGGGGGVSEATIIANYDAVRAGSYSYTTNLNNRVLGSAPYTYSYRYKCADNPYGYWTVWSTAQWTTSKNGNNINVSNLSTSDEFEKNVPLLIEATTGLSYTTNPSQEAPIINSNNTPNPKSTITSKGTVRVWSRIPITIFLDTDYATKGTLNINSYN